MNIRCKDEIYDVLIDWKYEDSPPITGREVGFPNEMTSDGGILDFKITMSIILYIFGGAEAINFKLPELLSEDAMIMRQKFQKLEYSLEWIIEMLSGSAKDQNELIL